VTAPQYIENDIYVKATGTLAAEQQLTPPDPARVAERKKLFRTHFDMYLVLVVGMLLSIGLMMVFSTTFDWSYQTYNDPGTIFLRQVRSVGVGLAIMLVFALIDYRIWKRFALWMMLVVIALLIALLMTAPELFGAQRAFINGSLQPGELAQLITIIYMAAWLAAKQAKIRRISYGLVPFSILVGSVASLIVLQPDVSTAGLILGTAVTMFFLAGADLLQMGLVGIGVAGIGWAIITQIDYAAPRLASYLDSVNDLRNASYHVQQAVIAFLNGGLTGVGLGEGYQKFGYLPAPHTDSIFAVIAEELGLVGCTLVTVLFVVLVMRGFRIARHAPDSFGSLLAGGITVWIAFEALLNIAVMTAILPFSGVPLPFISFGGSALVTSMAGIGLLLSVSRVTARHAIPERRTDADHHLSRGDGRRRVPRVRRSGSPAES
jgi:cell division protein FtsW